MACGEERLDFVCELPAICGEEEMDCVVFEVGARAQVGVNHDSYGGRSVRELLENGVVAFALEAVEEELALGGLASAVEAFNGNEGAAAGREIGRAHV